MIFEIAHHIGAVPLLWLAWLHFRGERRDAAWWWLAGAFFVSWLADTASHWTGHPLVSVTYPVTQAGLVGAVFLFRRDAMIFVVALVAVGIADLLWQGVQGPDVLLRTVAWLSVVGIVFPLRQLGRLRISLLIAYGAAWVCWLGYVLWPGWTSYLLYQGVRATSIGLFCVAALTPGPHFKLSRA